MILAQEHGIGFCASFALHLTLLCVLWLMAEHELARPAMGTSAITVRLVTIAQMQNEMNRPKPEEKPVPVVKHAAALKAKPVATQTSKLQPAQQWSEARNDSHGAMITYQPMPKIPDELRREALNSYALVRFHVAADGSATVELLTPSQNPRLNQLLMETLKTWRFEPATDNGNAVVSHFDIRVHFLVE